MNGERILQVVLAAVGLIFLLGVYPLMMYLWPIGFSKICEFGAESAEIARQTRKIRCPAAGNLQLVSIASVGTLT